MAKAWKSVGKAGAVLMLALTLLAAPASAQVPGPFARQLAQQLARGEQGLTAQGFVRVAGPFAGALAAGETARTPVTLRAGQDYRVLGVCDADCSDVDLKLYDSGMQLVSQDIARDDAPILTLRPTRTGQANIEVLMAGCAQAPCYYAFNVYSR